MEYPAHISEEFVAGLNKTWGTDAFSRGIDSTPEKHLAAMRSVDKAIVFGLQAKPAGYYVPNEEVASYVNKCRDKVVGFASVNPNTPRADKELLRCINKLGLKGLKLGPTYQNFDPASRKAIRIFRLANNLGIPVIIHQGTTFVRNAPLRYANPIQLEEVAIKFPDLKMVIAHLGHPWEDETAVLIRKQPNVFADISGVHPRLFRLYHKLMTFKEYGVLDKIVFGTDFPFFTPEETILGIKGVNSFASEHNLPQIPEEDINSIIYGNFYKVFSSVLR
jgi:predicted TIM-barrel fold metal-dependent hydrolase